MGLSSWSEHARQLAQEGGGGRLSRRARDAVLVGQSAYDLGFNDPFGFSGAFKKVFGLSPAAFRELR